MPVDNVQCGTCMSFMQPLWHPETGYCDKWLCVKCGRRSPAIGRERLITQVIWESQGNGHSDTAESLGYGRGNKQGT